MGRKEKKYHFIYKTIDTRNGNFYIGMHSTDNLNDGYIGSGLRLKKLICKHGKQIFSIEILEYLPDRESLKKREEEIVNSDLLKEDKCMNLKNGGDGGFSNDEHKKKFFDAAKISYTTGLNNGRIKQKWLRENDKDWNERVFKNRSNSKLGNQNWINKTHNEETKKKIGEKNSLKQKGEKNSQFGKCWVTNGLENKKIKKTDLIPEGWVKGRKLLKS